MQVLFLLYHYFKASEIYNAIRVFTGVRVDDGLAIFVLYVRKDFSFHRFAQMMWRLNFFVFFVCLAMRNDYVLYYICPMHTLFTCAVYLRSRRPGTTPTPSSSKIRDRFAASYAL